MPKKLAKTRLKCKGFLAAGVSSGIKKGAKKDLAIILSETPCVTAGVFTRNKVRAAPVVNDIKRLKRSKVRGIIVNSGNANACTGGAGVADDWAVSMAAESALDLSKGDMLTASTGVIGVPLPVDKITLALPRLKAALTRDGFADAAEAMMTTDAFPKAHFVKGRVGAVEVTLLGLAKGAGMIRPDMATLLAFILTDANIGRVELKAALRLAVDRSFNSICVDNDTSTNDTVLVLANGMAGGMEVTSGGTAINAFIKLLTELCVKLAKMIVEDGEGATKFVEIRVKGAGSDKEARKAAKTISESMLVKTAFFGADPNWGRILAAIGMAGIYLDQDKVDISLNGICVARNGIDTGKEKDASWAMQESEIVAEVNLKCGKGSAVFWTTDLGHDYVKINSEYRT